VADPLALYVTRTAYSAGSVTELPKLLTTTFRLLSDSRDQSFQPVTWGENGHCEYGQTNGSITKKLRALL
jgi:hypothetical protein